MVGLLDAGVTSVVCLQEDGEPGGGGKPFTAYDAQLQSLGAARGIQVAWVRHPVRDMTVPGHATVRAVLDLIHANPGVTYVHCWGGHGRTGVVAGCWLREQGLSAEEAFRHIRLARAHDVHLVRQPSPQTADQCAMVHGWAAAGAERGPT